MIWQPFLLFVFTWIIYLLWKRRKFYYAASKLNTDFWSFPLLGHVYLFFGSDEDRMNALIRLGKTTLKYKGLAKSWLGPRFFVLIADPINIEYILKTCLEKDETMNVMHELLGHASIFAPVPIWRPRRKLVAPLFSQNNLNQFINTFTAQSKVMIENLEQKSHRNDFSIWQSLATFSMNSVCETTLGVKVNSQGNVDHPFPIEFDKYCRVASLGFFLPPITLKIFKYFSSFEEYFKSVKYMKQFVDNVIEDKIQTKQANNESKSGNQTDNKLQIKSFLEMYINSSGGESKFTKLELREESLTLVLAGTDTSAVGAAFTCLMLAVHPQVQEKAYEEIKEVFGDSDRPLTVEDLYRLTYLEMVIKETLRLYPPVPVIVRKADKDFQLNNGLTIPKDTGILIHIWATHRNPLYWGSDAEEFRPERFIDSVPDHPAAFLPFSLGPRACLGYRYAMITMKTVLAELLRHYRLLQPTTLDNKTPLRLRFDIMMKHVDNFQVQIEPRSD